MKKIKKIAIGLTGIIAVASAGTYIWQRDNINAFYVALTQDTSKIAENIQKQQKERTEALEKYNITVSTPSLEVTEALINGEVSSEDVKNQLGLGTQQTSNSTDNTQSEQNTNDVQTSDITSQNIDNDTGKVETEQDKQTQLLNACANELYSLQVDLMAQLGTFMNEAKHKLYSMDKSEQTEDAKRQIALEGLNKCYDLEKVVDSQVHDILDSYRTKLESINGDTEALDTLWNYYLKEKNSQKSYYISKYLD